jgi:hypothetical protein
VWTREQVESNSKGNSTEKSMTKKEQIADINPKALFADGFDDALIGYDARSFCAVYDYDKTEKILVKRDGMSFTEAHEHMEFNVVGSYVGDFTPVFIHTF